MYSRISGKCYDIGVQTLVQELKKGLLLIDVPHMWRWIENGISTHSKQNSDLPILDVE